MSQTITSPEDIEPAWNQFYNRLASHIVPLLPSRGIFLEVGAGTGRLTILIARKLPNCTMVALDRFAGPYKSDRYQLERTIRINKLESRIRVETGDYQKWMQQQADSDYDAILSCDFIAEIDSDGLEQFTGECYRLLDRGGISVHSFLSPKARNKRQQLLIDADSNPKWTRDPPLEWFSPNPMLVVKKLKQAGFTKVKSENIRSNLLLNGTASRELLKSWNVKSTYWQTHRRILEKNGLEIPDFSIIHGWKA